MSSDHLRQPDRWVGGFSVAAASGSGASVEQGEGGGCGGGTTSARHLLDGAALLGEVLAAAGVPRGQATIVNGSGLFRGNLLAPAHLTRLLAHMYGNPGVRDEYVAQLAIGGVDGTLANRFAEETRRRVVRAKTGTLNDVTALSGYVLGPTPDRAVAFSILANGVSSQHAQARRLAEDLVRAILEYLYPNAG